MFQGSLLIEGGSPETFASHMPGAWVSHRWPDTSRRYRGPISCPVLEHLVMAFKTTEGLL